MTPLPFLFDLDGTLAETLPDIAASTNHVRALRRLPPLSLGEVRHHVGDGARTLVARVLGDGATEAEVDFAFAAYLEHHERQCIVHVKPFPGVVAHLTALRERGHPLAVVTNKAERFAKRIVAALDLGALLPVVVGGDTLSVKKPDPAPLRHALRALGCAPDAGTMVGDGLQDLRSAKAAGLRTIGCLFGYGDPAALRREGADHYWRAFGEPA